jgi:hypothetical protein
MNVILVNACHLVASSLEDSEGRIDESARVRALDSRLGATSRAWERMIQRLRKPHFRMAEHGTPAGEGFEANTIANYRKSTAVSFSCPQRFSLIVKYESRSPNHDGNKG